MSDQQNCSAATADDFEALREVEEAWLVSELGRAISNLAYPVGCGAAPTDYHLKAAAKALFDRYAKMVKMARGMRDDAQAVGMIDALREAERFMAYFADETDGVFVGPGTPQSCLAHIRYALAGTQLPAAPVETAGEFRRAYDAEKSLADYRHGYADGVEWAQTHGRSSADNDKAKILQALRTADAQWGPTTTSKAFLDFLADAVVAVVNETQTSPASSHPSATADEAGTASPDRREGRKTVTFDEPQGARK